MTNEEAIIELKKHISLANTESNEALELAIRSLETLNKLNKFCMQDDMHLVTIARIKSIINEEVK